MIARLGDRAADERMTRIITQTQQRLRDDQVAIASGKHAQRFADVADQATLLISNRARQSELQTHNAENETALLSLRTVDLALGGVVDLADRAQTLITARINGATGADLPFAAEVESMLAEVANGLNVQLGGRYLLAGSRTDTLPVTLPDPLSADPGNTDYYQGDAVKLTLRIGTGIDVPYGITADDPAIARLLAGLSQARIAGAANDTAALGQALDEVRGAVDEVTGLRGRLATATNRIESLNEQQAQAQLYVAELVNAVENTDVPAAATRISSNEASLEATYLTIAQLNRLSLADYLR